AAAQSVHARLVGPIAVLRRFAERAADAEDVGQADRGHVLVTAAVPQHVAEGRAGLIVQSFIEIGVLGGGLRGQESKNSLGEKEVVAASAEVPEALPPTSRNVAVAAAVADDAQEPAVRALAFGEGQKLAVAFLRILQRQD